MVNDKMNYGNSTITYKQQSFFRNGLNFKVTFKQKN